MCMCGVALLHLDVHTMNHPKPTVAELEREIEVQAQWVGEYSSRAKLLIKEKNYTKATLMAKAMVDACEQRNLHMRQLLSRTLLGS